MKKTAALLALMFVGCSGCALSLLSRAERAHFARLARSSVMILDENGGVGSGTIVKAEAHRALVLTAAHVVTGVKENRVFSLEAVCQSTIVKIDVVEDLALLEVPCDLKEPALPIASRAPERYDAAWLVGAAHGYARTPGRATIANLDFPEPYKKHGLFQVVSPMIAGDSGGTLANAAGELIGIPSHFPQELAAVKVVAQGEDGEMLVGATPFGAIIPVPHVGMYVGLWAIRDFLKGTEVQP